MQPDTRIVIAIIILLISFFSSRISRHGSSWRASYVIMPLALAHLILLLEITTISTGRFGNEGWAAITLASIIGLSINEKADITSLILVLLGTCQVLVLGEILNFSFPEIPIPSFGLQITSFLLSVIWL